MLPAGELELRVMRGSEYVPVTRRLTVKPEPGLTVRVVLLRRTDLERKGWFNGTNRTHMNSGSSLRNNLECMLSMAAAEDNDVLRRGRTSVSNGPLIRFSVDGELPGGEIRRPATGAPVNVAALLESLADVTRLEILFNGKVALPAF